MPGFLVPEYYTPEVVTDGDIRIAAITFGFILGFGLLTCIKIAIRTKTAWNRSRRATIFIIMIWGEMIASLLIALVGWLYLDGIIEPSFWLYVSICTCWSFQVQFLLQIIINRVSMIMYNDRRASQLKWAVAAFVACINISVYCVWIPARLQINERYIYVNNIWDRIEKVLYAICDAGLNAYFFYLVKNRLLSNGMMKYKPLFVVNVYAVICSLGMDVMLIGMMSLKNTVVYVLFDPVAYIVKLNIELTMADLISKITRSSQHDGFSFGTVSFDSHARQGLPESRRQSTAYYSDKRTSQVNHQEISGVDRDLSSTSSTLPDMVADFAFKNPEDSNVTASDSRRSHLRSSSTTLSFP